MLKSIILFLKRSAPVWGSIILIALVLKKMISAIRPEETGKILLSMDASWLLLAFLFTLMTYLVNSYRLAVISRWILGKPPAWQEALKITWLGSFFSLAAPFAAIGDVARAGLVKKQMKSSLSQSAQIVLFDRGFSIYCLILFSFVASCCSWSSLEHPEIMRTQMVVSLCLLAIPAIFLIMRLLISWPRNYLSQFIGSTLDSLINLLRQPACLLQQFVISLCNIVIYTGTFWAFSQALHFSFDIMSLMLFAPVVLIVNNLPFFYQGWGGREAVFLMLAPVLARGVAIDSVVATSLAYGVLLMASAMPGGIYLFGINKHR